MRSVVVSVAVAICVTQGKLRHAVGGQGWLDTTQIETESQYHFILSIPKYSVNHFGLRILKAAGNHFDDVRRDFDGARLLLDAAGLTTQVVVVTAFLAKHGRIVTIGIRRAFPPAVCVVHPKFGLRGVTGLRDGPDDPQRTEPGGPTGESRFPIKK